MKKILIRPWLRDVIIIAVLFGGIIAWQSRNLLPSDGSIVIRNLLLVDLNGNTEQLLADDKPTLIYFFAPWCTVCSLSINNLDYLEQQDMRVVVVAMDYSSINEVQEFADKNDVQQPILLGIKRVKSQFKVEAYPTYYMINKNKQVVARSVGYSSAVGMKLRTIFTLDESAI